MILNAVKSQTSRVDNVLSVFQCLVQPQTNVLQTKVEKVSSSDYIYVFSKTGICSTFVRKTRVMQSVAYPLA